MRIRGAPSLRRNKEEFCFVFIFPLAVLMLQSDYFILFPLVVVVLPRGHSSGGDSFANKERMYVVEVGSIHRSQQWNHFP